MEAKSGWSKVRFDEICKNIFDRVNVADKDGICSTDIYVLELIGDKIIPKKSEAEIFV